MAQYILKWIKCDIHEYLEENIPLLFEMCAKKHMINKDSIKIIDYLHHIDNIDSKDLLKDILIETLLNGHAKIRVLITKVLKIPIQSIPYYYKATKHRCKLNCSKIKYLSHNKYLLLVVDQNLMQKTNDLDNF